MKSLYKIIALSILTIAQIGNSTQGATINEIDSDIQAFQHYFQKRFPDLSIQDYNLGIVSLPQYAQHKESWSLVMELPPFEIDMRQARLAWDKPFENGVNFEACFSTHPPANEFPYFNGRRVITVIQAVNDCLGQNNEPTLNLNSRELAGLVAIFKSQSNGLPSQVDYSHPAMGEIYNRGRQLFWARRGQNNFSCASCHVDNAGNSARGEVVSAALGHGTGFPMFRYQWGFSTDDQNLNWGTLHRRYRICNIMAGAAPFEIQSPQYIALEVYQAIMNTGVPLNAPGFRQ